MDFWKDATKERPDKPGWYPVMQGFCPSEGLCADGSYWNGSEWDTNRIVLFASKVCDSRMKADILAFTMHP